ncbi:MAG: class I SAM-dependent methyltransferase [Chloroflexi bacterium]|nr:class I SAM-dependent methyltransferase [Chloroflexota bacterium]
MPGLWDARAGGPGSPVAPAGAAGLYARLALRARAAFVRHVLPDLAPGCVLDVGCGKGPWLRLLAAQGFTTVGVDRSWAMLQAARRAGRGASLLAQMDVAHLACADRACANVLAVTVLQHQADGAPAIAELARVARARIAVYELTASTVPRRLAPHVVARSVQWYRDAFLAHGWALRAAHEVGQPAGALWHGPRAVAHLAARHAWLVFAPALVDGSSRAR